MSAFPSLIPELEAALLHGSAEKHGEILRQITALFLESADHFNEDHIRLFDDLFGRLIEEIEGRAKAQLSRRLAPVPTAPIGILRRLANDDDIAVAEPVLTRSPRLGEKDLVAIARTKGQAHLLALSGREQLPSAVTDVLVGRGDRDVAQKVADNSGARISETGYWKLAQRAQKDGNLAESMAQRADIPDHVFRELLVRATKVVQRRLLATARPETQAEIRRILSKVSGEVAVSLKPKRDLSAAGETVRMAAMGTPDEQRVAQFAAAGRYEETVVALADICNVSSGVVDKMMIGDRTDPVLILCRSAGFSWTTARAVILARPGSRGKSGPALEQASVNFDKLSALTAQRVVRFWQAGYSRGGPTAIR